MKKHTLTLPRMGESITEGTLLNWLVGEGETFAEGDILCEVATDKVDNEVPAPAAGTLIKHLAAAKEVVAVGAPLAELELSDEVVVKAEASKTAAPKSAAPKTSKPKKKTATGYTVNENIFVSPLIEAIAREHHISFEELARIPATGNEGRLRKSDVMQYIADGRPYQFVQPASDSGFKVPDLKFDKGTGERVPMDRMRQMIADHMVFSKHTSPHVTAYVEADLTAMVSWRNEQKAAFQKKYQQLAHLH